MQYCTLKISPVSPPNTVPAPLAPAAAVKAKKEDTAALMDEWVPDRSVETVACKRDKNRSESARLGSASANEKHMTTAGQLFIQDLIKLAYRPVVPTTLPADQKWPAAVLLLARQQL